MFDAADSNKDLAPQDNLEGPDVLRSAEFPHSSAPEPARPAPVVPLLEYQKLDMESPARFRWNCWARQTGKSFTKSLRRILRGLERRRNQIFLSAGERQSRELMLKARQHCQALQIAAEFHEEKSFRDMQIKQLEIVLPGGVRIIGLPANPQTARGYTGDVFLDEFAMHMRDREIWAALFPTLLRGAGELDVASTPRGCGNMFFDLRDNDQFSASTVTLHDAIAQGLPADAEQIRRAIGDEEIFRQEFLCEFLDEATAFLTYEQILACVDAELVTHSALAPLELERRELFAGVDIGRVRDLTVIWVVAANYVSSAAAPSRTLQMLRTKAIVEMSGAPFREQFAVLAQLLALRQVRRCCIDAGGLGMQLAEQAIERFGPHRVESVVFTSALKSQLAGELRIAVENRRILIPHDDRIVRDWHSLTRDVGAGGHFRLSAPRSQGSHADRFWAAALAVHAAGDGDAARIERIPTAALRFARCGTW